MKTSELYAPPWREIIGLKANGRTEYGPWYGPTNLATLAKHKQAWEQTIYGGGLWDPAEPSPVRRIKTRRTWLGRKHAARTHCVKGHLFQGNLRIRTDGGRRCRECQKEYDATRTR